MINGKRLLFGMLAGTLLGRRARRVGRGFGGAGMGGGRMGLLGVAALMAARHFMQQRGPASSPASSRPGAGGTATAGGGLSIGGLDLGSLFGMGAGGGGGAAPQHAMAAAEVPPLDTPPTPAENEEAMTLIRAMVAAAQADGSVDPDERRRIIDGLTEAGADQEERDFILAELDRPHDFDAIVKAVHTREMAEEVYGAALLAIEVDTEAERWFLRNLAARLSLDDATVAALHERFETPRPSARRGGARVSARAPGVRRGSEREGEGPRGLSDVPAGAAGERAAGVVAGGPAPYVEQVALALDAAAGDHEALTLGRLEAAAAAVGVADLVGHAGVGRRLWRRRRGAPGRAEGGGQKRGRRAESRGPRHQVPLASLYLSLRRGHARAPCVVEPTAGAARRDGRTPGPRCRRTHGAQPNPGGGRFHARPGPLCPEVGGRAKAARRVPAAGPSAGCCYAPAA